MADPVWTMANLLLDCLEKQFTTAIDGLPTPGEFCLIAGEAISEDIDPLLGFDRCCDGLGWVRVGNTYPSSNFPQPDPVTVKCFPTSWAQELEIGLLGCYAGGGDPGMPSCPTHTSNSIADMARLWAIKKAICCWGEELNKLSRGRLWTTTSIEVSGPRSTCISRVGNILVAVPKCC